MAMLGEFVGSIMGVFFEENHYIYLYICKKIFNGEDEGKQWKTIPCGVPSSTASEAIAGFEMLPWY